MEFEWDEAKRERNIAKHGVDFLRAQALFDGRPVITASSPRGDEERNATTGRIEGQVLHGDLDVAGRGNPYHLGKKGAA